MTITLYLCGTDEDDAEETFPFFDSLESADSYARDNRPCKVYAVDAEIHFETKELVYEVT